MRNQTRHKPPSGYHVVSPYLLYENAEAAIAYLGSAFGFRLRRQEIGAAGRTHSELVIEGSGLVMLGQAGDQFRSAKSLGIHPQSMVHVYAGDIEALHSRARAVDESVGDLEIPP